MFPGASLILTSATSLRVWDSHTISADGSELSSFAVATASSISWIAGVLASS
jgi:hypothetical protein